MDPAPVVLQGESARLEPLAMVHAEDLLAVARDPDVWRYMPLATPETLDDVRATIANGTSLPSARRATSTSAARTAGSRSAGRGSAASGSAPP